MDDDLQDGLFWVRSGTGWASATPGECAAEIARLRAALVKIAAWGTAWPERNPDYGSMAVVTAREAVPKAYAVRIHLRPALSTQETSMGADQAYDHGRVARRMGKRRAFEVCDVPDRLTVYWFVGYDDEAAGRDIPPSRWATRPDDTR